MSIFELSEQKIVKTKLFAFQLSGRKQLILFEPYHNLQLYEGHIIEAMLTFRQGKFHREKLIESTAMTMSPLDITAPDFEVGAANLD